MVGGCLNTAIANFFDQGFGGFPTKTIYNSRFVGPLLYKLKYLGDSVMGRPYFQKDILSIKGSQKLLGLGNLQLRQYILPGSLIRGSR